MTGPPRGSAVLLAAATHVLNKRENTFTLTDWRTTMAKHARHAKKQDTDPRQAALLDDAPTPAVQSGHSIFNPTQVKDHMMSKTDAAKRKSQDAEARAAARAEREEAKIAKLAAKEEARAAKIAEREARAAEREAAKAERAAAREAARAEREARAAELGPQGKMAALRQAKAGYVKSATGQLRSNDELAVALDAVPAANVVPLALQLLQLGANPYSHLNTGQQSMNLRNKLRGAIKRGLITIADVEAARDEGGYNQIAA